jgi:hypothetical protein
VKKEDKSVSWSGKMHTVSTRPRDYYGAALASLLFFDPYGEHGHGWLGLFYLVCSHAGVQRQRCVSKKFHSSWARARLRAAVGFLHADHHRRFIHHPVTCQNSPCGAVKERALYSFRDHITVLYFLRLRLYGLNRSWLYSVYFCLM